MMASCPLWPGSWDLVSNQALFIISTRVQAKMTLAQQVYFGSLGWRIIRRCRGGGARKPRRRNTPGAIPSIFVEAKPPPPALKRGVLMIPKQQKHVRLRGGSFLYFPRRMTGKRHLGSYAPGWARRRRPRSKGKKIKS